MNPKFLASTPAPLTIALVILQFLCHAPSVAAIAVTGGDAVQAQWQNQAAIASASPPVIDTEPLPAAMAQTLPSDIPRELPPQILPRDPILPEPEPLPDTPPEPLPPPDELLRPTQPAPVTPDRPPEEAPQSVFVEAFQVTGSTVFDADELAALAWQATTLESDEGIPTLLQEFCPAAAPASLPDDPAAETVEPTLPANDTESAAFEDSAIAPPFSPADAIPATGRDLTFEQLLRARSVITQLYLKCGYITSGAILPPQTPAEQGNVITIQVVEGSLEDIEVTGLRRLNPGYVSSRLALAAAPPLNQQRLVEGLQLLQLDPLIQRISADLQTGTQPASSILQVEAIEADTFDVALDLNNNRSPSVGSFQRGLTFTQANLLGYGDGLSVTYTNTDGSNEVEGSYTIPLNPRNGTLNFRGGYTSSRVIEPPFDVLDISSDSFYYEATFRQPIVLTPTEEFALGLTFSRQESQTRLGIDDIGPFPLSRGADENGNTRISALRFTQEWLKRNPRQVLAARSQFSLGLDWFNATVNDDPLPDSQFFAWRGQGQWVQLLDDRGTLLLARTDAQLAANSLLPLEQFGIGGQSTVRGYRQDALLTDSGIYGSVEVRIPVWRLEEDWQSTFYLAPFIDAGTGWNVDAATNPDKTTLVGTGIGVLWEAGNNFSARLDWGIPLVSIESRERTWQESGVYFSIRYTAF